MAYFFCYMASQIFESLTLMETHSLCDSNAQEMSTQIYTYQDIDLRTTTIDEVLVIYYLLINNFKKKKERRKREEKEIIIVYRRRKRLRFTVT